MATNRELIEKLMGAKKYALACAHFIALPGSPAYDREGGMKKIIKQALRDTKILLDNGVHSILFVNEADIPYYEHLPIEGVAAFATVVSTVVNKLDIKIPYGINSIFDATTGLAVANATGATFMRGNFFGVWASRYGLYQTQAPTMFRMKSNLGMKQQDPPYFFCNIGDAVGADLTGVGAVEQAKAHAHDIYAQAHAWSIKKDDLELVKKVKKATPEFPIVVAAGTNHDNLPKLMEVFDGTIVASCLHEDGKLFAQVDPERTERFMKIFRSL
jgi:membrane complex biogenesis BtpA family protein